MATGSELIFDFGVLPDFVRLATQARTPPYRPNQHGSNQYGPNQRWKLELWRAGEVWHLKHHQTTIEILDIKGKIVRCSFAKRARGLGYTHLDLARHQHPRSPIFLLKGRFEDLEWLLATAQTLTHIWEIDCEEQDCGEDD